MSTFVIDAYAYCRLKTQRDGEIAIADLPRLAEELADRSGVLQWTLQGGTGPRGFWQLTLTVSGPVQLKCQRCLASFEFTVGAESLLILAKDEEHADEIDALLADDAYEVIVGSLPLDIRDLIVDEALLALPLAPKHAVCPAPTLPDGSKAGKEASPFAVLKNLKQ
jgi:uncharacterized protein